MAKMNDVFILDIGGPLCSRRCAASVIRLIVKHIPTYGGKGCYSTPEGEHGFYVAWHARQGFKACERRMTKQGARRVQIGLGCFAEGYLTGRNEK